MYRLNIHKITIGIARVSLYLIILIGSMSCGDGVTNSYDSLTDDWTLMGLEGEDVWAVAVSKEDRNLIFAGSGSNFSDGIRGKLFRSNNAGVDWDTLLNNVTVIDIKIASDNSNVVYVSLGITNFTQPGIIKSMDAGDTWEGINQGIPLNAERGVSQLAVDPTNSQIIYAGTGGIFGGSLYKSRDGGDSWSDIGEDINSTNFLSPLIDPSDLEVVYVSAFWTGAIYKSINGGDNWEVTGLSRSGGITDMAFVPSDPNKLIAGVGLGHARVTYCSDDAGATWSVLGDSIGGVTIAIDETSGDIYTGNIFGVFKLESRSKNWVGFNAGLDSLNVGELEYVSSHEILLAGTKNGFYGIKL